jgi:sensor c-di-GMP phosphodiesterase-like protein
MSRAKAEGGNRWEYYDAEMSVRMSRRWNMERGLRQAIRAGELVLHYQPVMEVASGRLCGAEALLRWERPGEGIVSPAEFIPLLEESGLIVPAGARILDLACAQIRQWRDGALPPFYVALNLSAVQLRSGDLFALVADALRRWEIPGEALVFEITETVLMERARRPRYAPSATRTRGTTRDRRFRYRLLFASLLEAPPVRYHQDRSVVHQRFARRRG